MGMAIDYLETDIDRVFAFYVKGYKMPPAKRLHRWEHVYDPHTGKVIFKLYVENIEGPELAKTSTT